MFDRNLLVALQASVSDRDLDVPHEQTLLIAAACAYILEHIPESEYKVVYGHLNILSNPGDILSRTDIAVRLMDIQVDHVDSYRNPTRRMLNCLSAGDKHVTSDNSCIVVNKLLLRVRELRERDGLIGA